MTRGDKTLEAQRKPPTVKQYLKRKQEDEVHRGG